MIFQCDGKSHETTGMFRFDTGSPHEPALFVTRDHASVFVQTMSRDVGVMVHRADLVEVRRLWRAHACSELARALGLDKPRAAMTARANRPTPRHRHAEQGAGAIPISPGQFPRGLRPECL